MPDLYPSSPWTVELTGEAHFNGLWGSGPTDVYAVGAQGAIFHSSGDGHWVEQTTGVNADLYCVWGSGANDIYVGGFGNTLLHSTGNGVWTAQTIPQLGTASIWGSSSSDVYLTFPLSMGAVYHSTGNGTWAPTAIGSNTSILSTVWGTASSNVYFGGGAGTSYDTPYIVHGPSTPAAEMMPTLPDAYLRNIVKLWGSGSSDIYAVGNSNTILHSTGTGSWTLESGPHATAGYLDVWGSGPTDIYVVSDVNGPFLHSTGNGSWTSETVPTQPMAIWGSGATDVYLAGDNISHKKL